MFRCTASLLQISADHARRSAVACILLGIAACGMPEEVRRDALAVSPMAEAAGWPQLLDRRAFDQAFEIAGQSTGIVEGDIAALQNRVLALRSRARTLTGPVLSATDRTRLQQAVIRLRTAS